MEKPPATDDVLVCTFPPPLAPFRDAPPPALTLAVAIDPFN